MQKILLRYGLTGAGILIGINVLVLLILGIPGPEDYATGEIIGYATIIVALLPIFFGIKYYRDELAAGAISFWQAVGVGLAIAVIPSVAFALYNLIYIQYIDPDFAEKYTEYVLTSARESMTAAEFQQYAADLESQNAMLTDPLVQTVVMFMTVFVIGLVIAVVSAMILRRKSAGVAP